MEIVSTGGLKVYPRLSPHAGEPGHQGLSPPTRGSLPQAPRSVRRSVVYPRPRGGAIGFRLQVLADWGLSPPTRGSPARSRAPLRPLWSIPAHAGEPLRRPAGLRHGGVYPRPRGGACEVALDRIDRGGLSPPTRGSPPHSKPRHPAGGSIPAHAGEPPRSSAEPCEYRVYPRPRGGARGIGIGVRTSGGLSPPTRGSRDLAEYAKQVQRSIPAHAGEPLER